jgi:hypothetical protein
MVLLYNLLNEKKNIINLKIKSIKKNINNFNIILIKIYYYIMKNNIITKNNLKNIMKINYYLNKNYLNPLLNNNLIKYSNQ